MSNGCSTGCSLKSENGMTARRQALGFLFLHQCRSYSIVRWPLSMKTTTKSKGIRPRWNEHPGRLATSCMHIGNRCHFFLTLLYPWYYVNCREEQQPATKRLLCLVFLVSKRGGVVVVGHCIPLLMRWCWDESKMSWIQKKTTNNKHFYNFPLWSKSLLTS